MIVGRLLRAAVNRRFRSQVTASERSVQNAEGWYRSRFTGMSEQAAQARYEAEPVVEVERLRGELSGTATEYALAEALREQGAA